MGTDSWFRGDKNASGDECLEWMHSEVSVFHGSQNCALRVIKVADGMPPISHHSKRYTQRFILFLVGLFLVRPGCNVNGRFHTCCPQDVIEVLLKDNINHPFSQRMRPREELRLAFNSSVV